MRTKQKNNEYMRLWRRANPARAKYHSKNSRAKKPEYYKLLQKAKYERWKKEKPERLKELRLKSKVNFSKKHPKYWLEDYRKNKERIKLAQTKFKLLHPERYRLQAKLAKLKRKNVVGTYTLFEWDNLLKQYGHTCPSCHRSEPQIKLHADHIIPIIKGGSNYIENIQPLCKSCNSSKYIKIIKFQITQ